MDRHTLKSGGQEAVITRKGAELESLRWEGLDLLWDARPLWPRHAPILFPVVGAMTGDQLRHQGGTYPMPKHGFARDQLFDWTERAADSCALALEHHPETRAAYPWPFRLEVRYLLGKAGLRMELGLRNPGTAPLPASLGLHPAFRWPLVPGIPKSSYRLVFDQEEPGVLRRLDGQGLLRPTALPTPIRHRVLPLEEALFQEDALIFLDPRSRSLRFEAEGGPSLALRWEGFPHLGVWTKPDPGPAYLCIEPWQGYASPSDWDGEFSEKPGGFLLAPGATRRWSLSIEPSAGT